MALSNQVLKYNHVLIQRSGISDDGTKSKPFDLTSGLQFTKYYESLTSPVITMTMTCRFDVDMVNGLPIRGGEMIAIDMDTLAGNFKFGKVDSENGFV